MTLRFDNCFLKIRNLRTKFSKFITVLSYPSEKKIYLYNGPSFFQSYLFDNFFFYFFILDRASKMNSSHIICSYFKISSFSRKSKKRKKSNRTAAWTAFERQNSNFFYRIGTYYMTAIHFQSSIKYGKIKNKIGKRVTLKKTSAIVFLVSKLYINLFESCCGFQNHIINRLAPFVT